MSKHPPYPPTTFYERLTELSKLKDGWLDGHGKAPSGEVLKSASVLGVSLPMGIVPRVYPTEAGGVSLEWDDQHGGHEIEVLPDGHLFLMTVERIAQDEMKALRAEVAAARAFAAEMREFCSPHGVSVGYADRLIEAMDRAKGTDPETPHGPVPAAYVRLKGQLETDLAQMTSCAAQPPKEGVEDGRIAQQGIAAGTRSSLAWAIHHFEGPQARAAFLKRLEVDER